MRGPLSAFEICGYRDLYLRCTRAETFFRMVIDDADGLDRGDGTTILDIGCGDGFHHDKALQQQIGRHAAQFLGVEPDAETNVDPCFSVVYPSTLESADIAPASVDLAYSAMVLEHVDDPIAHFAKIRDVLKPGGVYWGFTVDSRHWFALLSSAFERMRLKEAYLRLLHGDRGTDRYANFPTRYRCNSPGAIRAAARGFSSIQTLSLHKPGQLDFYLPRILQGASRLVDRASMLLGLPGSILVVRLVN